MNRQKTIVEPKPLVLTRQDADHAFSEYVKAGTDLDAVELELEQELNAIREEYAAEIATLKAEKESQFKKLHLFATQNKDLFAKSKSIDFAHGKLGFRKSTPGLDLLVESATPEEQKKSWEKVFAKVKKFLPDFIRVKEELNKKDLLSQCKDNPKFDKQLAKVGLKVVSSESFFVDPKTEKSKSKDSAFIASLLS